MKLIDEVSQIRQLVELLAKDMLKQEIESVATTTERKRIWALCDGSLNTDELAQKTNMSQRAVQVFVKQLKEIDLVTFERRSYPKRRYDYVPPNWDFEME